MSSKMMIKKTLKYVIGVIVILLITSFLGFVFRLQITELAYNFHSSPKTLIRLAVLSVEMKDEERIERYVPEALKLDDFVKISESELIFLSSLTVVALNKDSELAYRTYYRLMIEYVMIPFFNEDYDEFQRRFRYFFPQMANGEINTYVLRLIEWSDFFWYSKKFSEQEYDIIISSLKFYLPEPFEVLKENIPEAYQRAYTNLILSYVYTLMDDEKQADIYETQQWNLLREIGVIVNE
jgi:hypothetical protein